MPSITFWGLTASPYQLKMQSLLNYTGHTWERWPDQAGRLAALSMAARLQLAKWRGERDTAVLAKDLWGNLHESS